MDSDGVVEPYDAQSHGSELWLSLYPEIIRRKFSLNIDYLIDFAELWTFIFPKAPVPRSVQAAAKIVNVTIQEPNIQDAEQAAFHIDICRSLLRYCLIHVQKYRDDTVMKSFAAFMQQAHWAFASAVCANLNMTDSDIYALGGDSKALRIIDKIPKWVDEPQGSGDLGRGISEEDTVRMLTSQLPQNPELRPSQIAYSKQVQQVFSPSSNVPRSDDQAHLHLLQAGTGIGKTLGYLAPARIWAERNDEPVWISTYSRHLQDQIAVEVKRLAPSKDVVIRKGRENYLCLLNYEEFLQGSMSLDSDQRVMLALIARWMLETDEGIMIGADFPLWLEERTEPRILHALRLKQGECLYSGCPHFERCYIESGQRRSRTAKLIIANHALTLRQAIQGSLPYSRLIIDEAHQLFDATDSATRLRLGLYEVMELRRWLLGAGKTAKRRSRRGLNHRTSSLTLPEKVMDAVQNVLLACQVFGDSDGATERILEKMPLGILEEFFSCIMQEMHKTQENIQGYAIEAPLTDAEDSPLKVKAEELHQQIERLYNALIGLIRALYAALDALDEVDATEHNQISSLLSSLEEYPLQQIHGWLYLLARLLGRDPQAANENMHENTQETDKTAHPSVIERIYMQPVSKSRPFEVGLEMVFRDPTEILQNWLYAAPQKAILLTSASLGADKNNADWTFAHRRTGAHHLIKGADQSSLPTQAVFESPFNYANQSEVFVASDVDVQNASAVHAAYFACFLASAGGGLGLFTAIQRTRICYQAINAKLLEQGITLYSQHDDPAGNMLLAECMRQQENACLLATDAFRDGVDIPGRSLRLVVMDRLPWARPDLIHRHRKAHFGARYNQDIVQQRLMQAFGRLIRSADDKGDFVLLDRRLPSALEKSFPVPVQRRPLAEILEILRSKNI